MAVNIINTHAKPSTSFFNIFGYKDRMSLTLKMDGEKRKRLAKKNVGKVGMATFSGTCTSKLVWQFRKFSFYSYKA